MPALRPYSGQGEGVKIYFQNLYYLYAFTEYFYEQADKEEKGIYWV